MSLYAGIEAGLSLGWYLEDAQGALIPATLPDGVATFALGLEHGYTLTWKWPTDVIPTASGGETREPRNNRPQEAVAGGALLIGDESAAIRNELATYIAGGYTFLLALPHEELILTADASGAVVPVSTTNYSDWLNPGQRVVVTNKGVTVKAVVQSHDATSITLDISPGSVGKRGAKIMPLMPVYLEPQQDFDRYRTKAERWKISARAATFGFARTLASIALGPLTAAPGLTDATLTERVAGTAPSFQMIGDGIGGVSMTEAGNVVTIHFVPGGFFPSNLGTLKTVLDGSTLVAPTGTWGAGLMSAGDEVPLTALPGGQAAGPVGTGASLTMYAGSPVWDRKLVNTGTNTDSIDAMTEIIDFGGRPYAVGLADAPRWPRAVNYRGRGLADFQWLKLFLVTVRGAAKTFWLSTWRDDLPVVSFVGPQITVSGDVGTWYPKLRQHLHIREADGSDVYAKIGLAVDNGDGTWTLSMNDIATFIAPVAANWLELSRFASQAFPVTFGAGASHTLNTRVVVVPE